MGIKAIRGDGLVVVSFNLWKLKVDYARFDGGMQFIQFGKRFYLKTKGRPPMFLLSRQCLFFKQKGDVYAGKLRRPLSFNKIWEVQNGVQGTDGMERKREPTAAAGRRLRGDIL